jgi:hypothetical protein
VGSAQYPSFIAANSGQTIKPFTHLTRLPYLCASVFDLAGVLARAPLPVTVDVGYYIGRMQYAPTDDVGNYAHERAKRPRRGVLHTPI